MIVASIDPGVYTGVGIFDFRPDLWVNLIDVGTVRDNASIIEYCDRLEKMKARHKIDLALIEQYQNFGKYFANASKVREEIRACRDVFPNKIMIKTGQWNPRHFKDSYKRMLAASTFNRIFTNSHTTDAVLMGNWFLQFALSWARFTGISPEAVVMAIATKFGCVPRRGELLQFFRDRQDFPERVNFSLCPGQ